MTNMIYYYSQGEHITVQMLNYQMHLEHSSGVITVEGEFDYGYD